MLREGNYGSSRISEGGTHEEMLHPQDQKVLGENQNEEELTKDRRELGGGRRELGTKENVSGRLMRSEV